MKEKIYIALISLVFGINLQAQSVKVNPYLKIEETNITYRINGWNYKMYSSYDNKKTDSLVVQLTKISTSSMSIEIDGKHSMKVEFENYELVLNADNYKNNESIMGYFTGTTKLINRENRAYQIEFQGVFRHVIGKFMIKHNANSDYIIMDEF